MGDNKLTEAQRRALWFLAELKPSDYSQALAVRLRLNDPRPTAQFVASTLRPLLSAGLISRELSQAGGNIFIYAITPAGRAALQEANAEPAGDA